MLNNLEKIYQEEDLIKIGSFKKKELKKLFSKKLIYKNLIQGEPR